MQNIKIVAAFETEVNKIDDYSGKVSTYDSLYWLNQAVLKYVKTRFTGNNASMNAFEQDEKRARDLINLLTEVVLLQDNFTEFSTYDEYRFIYPDNFMFMLDEYTQIAIPGEEEPVPFATEIFECTLDSYMYRVTNKLTDFHLRNGYARPLRVRTQNGCVLLTDKQYLISNYKISYIRKPGLISLEEPFEEYLEFQEYAILEIIKLAAQLYIENQADPRYQTINNEIDRME